jgi:hypothetical protein
MEEAFSRHLAGFSGTVRENVATTVELSRDERHKSHVITKVIVQKCR